MKPKKRGRKTQAAAAVEFAICAPLLFMVAWGCIELTRFNLMKNVTYHAAFEAARIGVKPGATVQEVIAEANYQMKYVCNECEVLVTPDTIDQNTDEINVTVRVDIREQGLVIPQYFSDPILEAAFTIKRDNVSPY